MNKSNREHNQCRSKDKNIEMRNRGAMAQAYKWDKRENTDVIIGLKIDVS